MLRDTVSYRQANSDAHRVRSTNITPPAMTWHMAFWIPKVTEEDPSSYGVFSKSKNKTEFQDKIDAIFVKITKELRIKNKDYEIFIKPSVGDMSILFNKYVNKNTLEDADLPKNSPSNYILEDIKINDHRVVILEFKWTNYWITIRCGIQTEYFTLTVIVESAREKYDRKKENNALEFFAKALDNYVPNTMTLSRLYNEFWDEFRRFIYDLNGVRDLMDEKLFKEVFADFRGLITNDRPNIKHERNCKITEWAINSISNYRDELTQKIDLRDGSLSRNYECTASFMLDKAAVYMTALGPQIPDRTPGTRNPGNFVVFIRNDPSSGEPIINKWQLGRLVDRINFLGRVRLAALRNVKILRLVSIDLSRIDFDVNNAREAIKKFSAQDKVGLECISAIEGASKKLNSISNRFISDDENVSRSGILYRVERSRYYVNLFRNTVPRTRLARIEGYQQYDHFVEKRLGGTFDSIDRIGIRYERAMRAVAAIEQNYLAARSHKTGKDVKKIQHWGEFFLVTVLIPYYLIGIFKYLVDSKAGYEPSMFYIGAAIWIAACTVGTINLVLSSKSWKISLYLICFVVFMLVTVIGASTVPKKVKSAEIQEGSQKVSILLDSFPHP